MFAKERQPIALLVWPPWAAHVRSFIPVDPQPSQVMEDALGSSRADSRPIQILQAKDERSASRSGEQPGQQGGTQIAQMQRA